MRTLQVVAGPKVTFVICDGTVHRENATIKNPVSRWKPLREGHLRANFTIPAVAYTCNGEVTEGDFVVRDNPGSAKGLKPYNVTYFAGVMVLQS
jgi:hypothetical protein